MAGRRWEQGKSGGCVSLLPSGISVTEVSHLSCSLYKCQGHFALSTVLERSSVQGCWGSLSAHRAQPLLPPGALLVPGHEALRAGPALC